MVRSYDMRRRSLSAEATRQGIIDAAHRLLNRPDGGSLALQEIAEAAGVSRATIYNRIGSRRALLTAVFEDQGRLIEFDRVLRAMQLDDPSQAVLATVRESCRAWSIMPVAIRRTLALAVMDAEVGELVETFERYRRVEVRGLVERASSSGAIREGIDVGTATGTLGLLTSFPAFDHLRLEHSVADATRLLVRMTAASLDIHLTRE